MKVLSTGEVSNVATWVEMCRRNFGDSSNATRFMQAMGEDAPNGFQQEVVADEGELMLSLASIDQN